MTTLSPPRAGLRPKQELLLEFWRMYYVEHGLPPTVREAQAFCSISSTSVVVYNLKELARKGYLRTVVRPGPTFDSTYYIPTGYVVKPEMEAGHA